MYDHNDPLVAIQNRDTIEAAFSSLPLVKKGRLIKKHAVFEVRRKDGSKASISCSQSSSLSVAMVASQNSVKARKTTISNAGDSAGKRLGSAQRHRDDDEISIGHVGETVVTQNGSSQVVDYEEELKDEKEGEEVLLFGVDDKENLETMLSSLTGVSSKQQKPVKSKKMDAHSRAYEEALRSGKEVR